MKINKNLIDGFSIKVKVGKVGNQVFIYNEIDKIVIFVSELEVAANDYNSAIERLIIKIKVKRGLIR